MPSSSVPTIVFELLPRRRTADRLSVLSHTGRPRKLHLRRLFDLLHLAHLRRDAPRAQRIWSILVRCREVDFPSLWDLGLRVMHLPYPSPLSDEEAIEKHLGYLKACQNLAPEETAKVLLEYICVLVAGGRPSDALDELQIYLSIPPCSQHAGLHEYAGMVALSLAPLPPLPPQSEEAPEAQTSGPQNIAEHLSAISKTALFKRAMAYFQRAHLLDPTSTMSAAYLELMASSSDCPEEVDLDS